MSEELGTKDLQEAVVGVLELSVFMIQRFKDGAQLSDAVAIWDKWKDDVEFQGVLKAAVDGYENIAKEGGDLDAAEVVGLIGVMLPYVLKVANAFKKEETD